MAISMKTLVLVLSPETSPHSWCTLCLLCLLWPVFCFPVCGGEFLDCGGCREDAEWLMRAAGT